MEGYNFLDRDYDISLPVLVLAIEQNPQYPREYKFKPTRKWLPIQHQTAGYACHQRYLDGFILNPRNPERLKLLNDVYLDSCINMWGLVLSQVNEYNKRIQELLGVTCEFSFMDLEEGIYPIDATQENIKLLAKDKLPKELDNLVDWSAKLDKSFGCIGRWKLFILGDNCD